MKSRNDSIARKAFWLSSGAVLMLGVCIRFYFLHEPVRLDEGYTLLHFAANPVSLITSDYSFPNNHLLHSIVMHAMVRWIGVSDVSMRSPALAAGVIVLVLLLALTWVITHDHLAVFYAVLFGSASYPLWNYAVNGRGYSMQMMFVLLLALWIWRIDRWRSLWLGAIVAGGIVFGLLYTVPSGVIVAVPLFIVCLGRTISKRQTSLALATVLASTVCGLALIAALGPIARQIMVIGSGPNPERAPVLLEAARMASDGILPELWMAFAFLLGLMCLARRRPGAAWLAGAMILGYPVMLLLFGNWLHWPAMFARSYTPVFPLMCGLAGWGVAMSLRWLDRSSRYVAIIIGGLVVSYPLVATAKVLRDPATLYFPERPIMAAGQALVPDLARTLKRGDTIAGAGFPCDMAAAYYVIRERGFHGFYSLFDPRGRHLKTVYLLTVDPQDANTTYKQLTSLAPWSTPQKIESSGPVSIYVMKRKRE